MTVKALFRCGEAIFGKSSEREREKMGCAWYVPNVYDKYLVCNYASTNAHDCWIKESWAHQNLAKKTFKVLN